MNRIVSLDCNKHGNRGTPKLVRFEIPRKAYVNGKLLLAGFGRDTLWSLTTNGVNNKKYSATFCVKGNSRTSPMDLDITIHGHNGGVIIFNIKKSIFNSELEGTWERTWNRKKLWLSDEQASHLWNAVIELSDDLEPYPNGGYESSSDSSSEE